jgi:hypothetical protein
VKYRKVTVKPFECLEMDEDGMDSNVGKMLIYYQ